MTQSVPETNRSTSITEEVVKELQEFHGEGTPVLSVYLDTSLERQPERTFRTVFRDAVQALHEQLDETRREALAREAEVVQGWLDGYEPQGSGLALFSCRPRDFWREYPLPRPVRDDVVLDDAPFVRPLLDVVDEFERYAVALVDRERARLFVIYLGQIEESIDLEDRVSREDKQEVQSTAKRQRHYETRVRRHLKQVAERLDALARRRTFDRLVLGGPEETVAEFERLLPSGLQSRVVGKFSIEMVASPQEVLDKTLPLVAQVERTQEQDVVSDLIETAGSGQGAVVGLAGVIDALVQGRVHRLVVTGGFTASGSACPNCSFLSPREEPACPACSQVMEPVPDLAERAVEVTLAQDGQVETVHGDPAVSLAAAGGIGAFLRW